MIACFGCPKQEKWIYENINKYNAKVSVCAGATVDFLAENVKRAPRWMSEHGLEWFYRFLQMKIQIFAYFYPHSNFAQSNLFVTVAIIASIRLIRLRFSPKNPLPSRPMQLQNYPQLQVRSFPGKASDRYAKNAHRSIWHPELHIQIPPVFFSQQHCLHNSYG